MPILTENEHAYEIPDNKLLSELLGSNWIGVNVDIAKVVGLNAATLLYYFARWSLSSRNDGWVYRTQAEIEEQTTIRKDAQQAAIDKLKGARLIEVTRRGRDRRNYYKVNVAAAVAIVRSSGETVQPNTSEVGGGKNPPPVTVESLHPSRQNPATIRESKKIEKKENSVDTGVASAPQDQMFSPSCPSDVTPENDVISHIGVDPTDGAPLKTKTPARAIEKYVRETISQRREPTTLIARDRSPNHIPDANGETHDQRVRREAEVNRLSRERSKRDVEVRRFKLSREQMAEALGELMGDADLLERHLGDFRNDYANGKFPDRTPAEAWNVYAGAINYFG